MLASKPTSLKEVENQKTVETGSSLEEEYLQAGLSPDDASFLANFSNERRTKCIRKIDWRLCPALMILYLCAYIDRANIGNAKIEGLLTDLSMSGEQYNIALSVFFITYVLCEVPSNILLGKFNRPSIYIGILTLGWGIVMTLTGVVQNFGGLVATRFILGLFEAGFFPGAVLLVSRWYMPHETQTRLALFYTASAMAGAFSGLLAFGIAKMDGIGGYAGWRWIFIVEGLASVALGVGCFFFLVDSPTLSTRWLEPDEIRFLALRKQAERGPTVVDESEKNFSWATLWDVLKDWHLYLQVFNFWSNAVPNYGMKFTLPQIIKNMGYTSANAQLLTIPPYTAGAISAYVFALLADKVRWRMPVVLFGQTCVIIAFAVLFNFSDKIGENIPVCYFAVVLACIGLYPILPGVNAWTSNNLAGPRKRGIGIALMICLGNLGGIPGSFIYIEKESPRYPTGFGSSFAFPAVGVLVSLILELRFYTSNKKNAQMSKEEIHDKYTDEQLQKMGDRSPLYKYML